MELHERLSSSNPEDESAQERDPYAEIKNRIHLALVSELGPRLFGITDSASVRSSIESEIHEQLEQEASLSGADRKRLREEIAADVFGYGPLQRLLADSTVSEIMVNG